MARVHIGEFEAGCADNSIAECGSRGRLNPFRRLGISSIPATIARRCVDRFSQSRRCDDADRGLSFSQVADQSSELRQANRERGRTVDGIEKPEMVGFGASFAAVFFAEYGVGWIAVRDPAAHELFSAEIGFGDFSVVRFAIDGNIPREREDEFGCFVCDGEGEFEDLVEIWFAH